jgi:hypothetical protein
VGAGQRMVEDLSVTALLAAAGYFALGLLAPLSPSAVRHEVGVNVDLAHRDGVRRCRYRLRLLFSTEGYVAPRQLDVVGCL